MKLRSAHGAEARPGTGGCGGGQPCRSEDAAN